MEQNKKHTSLVGSSIRIFIIRFFSTLASLIFTIFFSHQLAPGHYGAYQNFWTQLTALSSIGCLGLGLLMFNFPAATLRHLISRLKPRYYLGYFSLLLVLGVVFALLHLRQNAQNGAGGWLSFSFFILYTVCILLESFLILLRRFNLLTGAALLYALAFVGAALFSYRQGFRLEVFLSVLLPFLLIRSILLFVPFYQYLKQKPEGKIIKPGFKSVQSLWMHLGFYDIITMLIIWLDKVIISLLASQETAAIYFNGSIPIPFLPIVLSAVSNATLMQLTQASDPEEKAMLMQQAGKVLSCAAYPLFFFLLVYRQEFVTTVFSSQYQQSVPIFLCAILILPVRAYSNTIVLQNLQQGKIMNLGVMLDFVVAIALAYPLYMWIGLGGIALSFVISTYVQSLFYLYHSAKLLKAPMWQLVPLKNWGLKATFFGSLTFILHLLLHRLEAMASLVIAAVVCGIAAAVILKIEMNKTHRTHT